MFSIGHASAHDAELWDLKSYELPDGKLDLARLQRDYKIRKTSVSRKSSVQIDAVSTNWRAQAPVVFLACSRYYIKGGNFSSHCSTSDDELYVFAAQGFHGHKSIFGAHFKPICNWCAILLTRDLVAHSTTWMADATVAAAYTYFVQDIRNPFIGVTVAPYVTLRSQYLILQRRPRM